MDAHIPYAALKRRRGVAERLVLAMASRLAHGRLTVRLPDGAEHDFHGEGAGPRAEVWVRHPRLFRRLLNGGAMALTTYRQPIPPKASHNQRAIGLSAAWSVLLSLAR